jgi:hypothetical protein
VPLETRVPGSDPSAAGRASGIEAAAYAGAAAGMSAAGVVLGDAPGAGAQVLVLTVIGVVLAVAGWFLEEDAPVTGRMRSIFWFLSVLVTAEAAGVLFGRLLEGLSPRTIGSLTGLVATAYSLVLWWGFRRSLQVLALIFSVYATVASLLFPEFGFFGVDPTGITIFTWLYGGAVAALGALGLVLPRKTTFVTGTFFAILGPLILTTNESFGGPLLALLTAAVLLFVGAWLAERAVAGLAIVGILLAVAIMVATNVSSRGPGIAVVVVGAAILAVAVFLARRFLVAPPRPGPAPPPPPPP